MAVLLPLLVLHGARRTEQRPPGPWVPTARRSLSVGAGATVTAAVAFDLLAGEHPTHTLGLVLVALAVAGMSRRLTGRHEGLLSAVSAAVVAQPALHAASKLLPPSPFVAEDGVLHVLTADGPTTIVQLAVSVAVVFAVAVGGQLARLLLSALHRPVQLLMAGPQPPPLRASLCVSTKRHGSMLRWCGWSIRAARRGPPYLSMP